MKSQNVWKPNLYDAKISYVTKHGKGIFDILDAQFGERILDIGCGTGDLTQRIADAGAIPLGIDASNAMIETAKQKHPQVAFQLADATDFNPNEKFDAVFSNAALHWMKDAEAVIQTVKNVLHPGGRFVAEFGGKDNIATVLEGLAFVLNKYNGVALQSRNPWYFPSIGEYAQLLEKNRFRITFAEHFDRPTTLTDGENGLENWLDSFADDFFPNTSANDKSYIYNALEEYLAPSLFSDGNWVVDYKRLRISAIYKQ